MKIAMNGWVWDRFNHYGQSIYIRDDIEALVIQNHYYKDCGISFMVGKDKYLTIYGDPTKILNEY